MRLHCARTHCSNSPGGAVGQEELGHDPGMGEEAGEARQGGHSIRHALAASIVPLAASIV
jgi:hypothetical protein